MNIPTPSTTVSLAPAASTSGADSGTRSMMSAWPVRTIASLVLSSGTISRLILAKWGIPRWDLSNASYWK